MSATRWSLERHQIVQGTSRSSAYRHQQPSSPGAASGGATGSGDEPIRGNVDTRLRKLDEGEYVAIVLAAAGLHRLGGVQRITECLGEDLMVPAVGQGALAIETRGQTILLLMRSSARSITRLLGSLALRSGHSLKGWAADVWYQSLLTRRLTGTSWF